MRFGLTRREIKPVTKEQEREFGERLKENKVGFKESVIIVLTAFVTIVLPCILTLGALSLFVLWIFGAFG